MVAVNPRDGFIIVGQQIILRHLRYDNSLSGRCNPQNPTDVHGLDCSTFVALALIMAGEACDPCTNSWALAAQCRGALRPQWLTDQFGPGHGTEITQAQAMITPGVVWFHMEGEGHIEVGIGTPESPGKSMGAHSHSTGIGYANYSDIYAGFFDYFAILPQLLPWFFVPPAPKVVPMFNPTLVLAARLRNPGGQGHVGGWWEGYDNGLVDFLGDDGSIVHGGMSSPNDVKNFAAHGEHLSRLEPRMFGSPPQHGYTIIATDGNAYVPEAQH